MTSGARWFTQDKRSALRTIVAIQVPLGLMNIVTATWPGDPTDVLGVVLGCLCLAIGGSAVAALAVIHRRRTRR